MKRVRISERYQVNVPKEVRSRLGLGPGDRLTNAGVTSPEASSPSRIAESTSPWSKPWG
jgi:hypothetical protein